LDWRNGRTCNPPEVTPQAHRSRNGQVTFGQGQTMSFVPDRSSDNAASGAKRNTGRDRHWPEANIPLATVRRKLGC